MALIFPFVFAGSSDLTEAEEAEIETIRKHRKELLEDIQVGTILLLHLVTHKPSQNPFPGAALYKATHTIHSRSLTGEAFPDVIQTQILRFQLHQYGL